MIAILLGALVAAPANAAPIYLACVGEADAEGNRYGDAVGVRIRPDGTGEARLPRKILPIVKVDNNNGWFSLKNVRIETDEITAQVRLNVYNKPRIHLDRITGNIRIDGPLGNYSGQCQPYDPTSPERKF